jgi:hypothetical protein
MLHPDPYYLSKIQRNFRKKFNIQWPQKCIGSVISGSGSGIQDYGSADPERKIYGFTTLEITGQQSGRGLFYPVHPILDGKHVELNFFIQL